MKAIETKGRILPNGSIQLDEPVDMATLDGVAELSLKEGPPVSNREHDQYLYGGNG